MPLSMLYAVERSERYTVSRLLLVMGHSRGSPLTDWEVHWPNNTMHIRKAVFQLIRRLIDCSSKHFPLEAPTLGNSLLPLRRVGFFPKKGSCGRKTTHCPRKVSRCRPWCVRLMRKLLPWQKKHTRFQAGPLLFLTIPRGFRTSTDPHCCRQMRNGTYPFNNTIRTNTQR